MEWTDERLDRVIGSLLRIGVTMAGATVMLGGIWYLARYGGGKPGHHVFRGEPSEFRSMAGVLRGLSQLHAPSFIQLGLLLLIATPVARVAFSVFAFAARRDWLYVLITLIVLAILLGGLFGGGA
jgi:uncharacterized membrane protein